jgi:S1-C subfamily serine protease
MEEDMTADQSNNPLFVSNVFTNAVDKAALVTAMVDARKRLPVSGVLFAPDLVLSVDHGLEKEDDIPVQVNESRAVGKAIGRDSGLDLAVLRLDHALAFEDLSSSEPGRVGMPVFAVGKPEPDGVQASFGTITAAGQALRTMRGSVLNQFYATSTTAYPGFSGGPTVNLAGQILGINTSGLIGGTSLVIPYAIALEVANMLVTHGKVRRGYLGVRTQRVQLPEIVLPALDNRQKHGLLVMGLEENGPALAGGIITGDILVGINQHLVDNQDSLMLSLSSAAVGDKISIDVVRGGQIHNILIVLGERQ